MSTGIPVAVAQQLQAMQAHIEAQTREMENMRVALKSLQEDNASLAKENIEYQAKLIESELAMSEASFSSVPTGRSSTAVATKNRFAVLDDEGGSRKRAREEAEASGAAVNPAANNGATATSSTTVAKKKHSPAFIVKEMSTPKFIKAMKEQKINVATRILPSGKQRINCEYDQREKVKSWLETNKVEGQTSTPNCDRKRVAIVKGIHVDFTEAEVKEFLEEASGITLESVKRFQKEQRDGVRPLHWWIVKAATKSAILDIRTVKEFLGAPISWEPLRSQGVIRCFKCQSYGHQSKNCFNKERCARCKHAHNTTSCTLPEAREGVDMKKYFCVNCEKRGHWAGDRNCPARLAAEAKLEAQRARRSGLDLQRRTAAQRIPTQEDFNIPVSEFSDHIAQERNIGEWNRPLAGSNFVTREKEPGNPWGRIEKETEGLFGRPAAEMLRICSEFVQQSERLRSTEEKKAAYLQFFMRVSGWGV